MSKKKVNVINKYIMLTASVYLQTYRDVGTPIFDFKKKKKLSKITKKYQKGSKKLLKIIKKNY